MCGFCNYRLAELYDILSDVLETLNPKGIPRTSALASLHRTYPVFAGIHLFLFASLNSVHFHGAFLNRIFISSPLGVYYSHGRAKDALYITSYKLN